jgi:dipeptidyl aminopeptidase/acylaminoacyl peptidase
MNAGLANVIGFYGEMADDGTAYGNFVAEQTIFHLNGTLWEQRSHYLENSPIFHLDRVQTPLLIVHGGADGAVAPFLADEVFVGLRRLGKEVVYAKYLGEGHHQSSWSLANQLDYWQRTLAFFDHHLKAPAAAEREVTGPHS